MSPDLLFQYANTLVLPAWALLVFAPNWKWTSRIVVSGITLILAAVYVLNILPELGKMELESFQTLAGVLEIFKVPEAVLVGWIHYLAFDLLAGWLIVTDARRLGINHWLTVPCLLLSFMLGPTGWLLYWIVRTVKKGSWWAEQGEFG